MKTESKTKEKQSPNKGSGLKWGPESKRMDGVVPAAYSLSGNVKS